MLMRLAAVPAVSLTVLAALFVPLPVSAGPTERATTGAEVSYVVAVSVDGLNPDAIRKLGEDRAPTFHRLMREGAFTLNARTAYEATSTLPNHATMFTGRRVRAARGGHGLTVNKDPGRTLHKLTKGYVASVFDVVHDHGGSTALYAGKDKFRLFKRTWVKKGAPDIVGVDNGTRKIDRFTYDTDDGVLLQRLTTDLAAAPRTFSFLHLAEPDAVGHASGFMKAKYLRAVRRADKRLAQLLAIIENSPEMTGRTALLVTADHGGLHGHLDPTKRYAYTVPFFVWGPGVPEGGRLYRMNPWFKGPGGKRVGYAKKKQPIRNGLVANLSTSLLGLPAVDRSTIDPKQRFTATP